VQAIVQEMGTRQACNRLTGCTLPTRLGLLGPEASPAIQALYLRTKGDALGRIKLVEAVALTGDPEAARFFLTVLKTDRMPPARVEAAFGRARLGHKKHIGTLKEYAASLKPKHHQPILLAIGFALARLGDPTGVPMIERNFELPGPDSIRWDPLRPGIRAARMLRLQSLAPKLAVLTQVRDPYIRRDAVTALGQMGYKGAFPQLIDRLDDEMPFVRRAALTALKQLTGFRYKETSDQWQRWWQQQKRADNPSPKADE